MQSFDSCTKPLGPLKQILFSCLTCNPPPSDPTAPYNPAGVCYGCSISCHGEHTLVELFTKRNFACDCGTTRLPSSAPCTLRVDEKSGVKGSVHSEEPAAGNVYNQNFRNRFCGCGEIYDPTQEKGTMFQCLGLGTVETGGCGEDWWHPECLMGLPRDWNEGATKTEDKGKETVNGEEKAGESDEEPPLPPGFPAEEDFDALICYKCVEANPWLKRYAGTTGFLPPVYKKEPSKEDAPIPLEAAIEINGTKKRKLEGDAEEPGAKRAKEEPAPNAPVKPLRQGEKKEGKQEDKRKHDSLPNAPAGTFSLFCKEDFRDHLCRCATCFPSLAPHIQLREEEEVYEPPLSENGDDAGTAGSQHTGSLLERGEAALSNVDRVRAIEGVMVYNHLKDKVKEFLKPFAETGEAVSAEAIKAYFEKLRGDEQGIQEAKRESGGKGGKDEGDNRREQSGMSFPFYYHFVRSCSC